jgi:hypothetical protein
MRIFVLIEGKKSERLALEKAIQNVYDRFDRELAQTRTLLTDDPELFDSIAKAMGKKALQ